MDYHFVIFCWVLVLWCCSGVNISTVSTWNIESRMQEIANGRSGDSSELIADRVTLWQSLLFYVQWRIWTVALGCECYAISKRRHSPSSPTWRPKLISRWSVIFMVVGMMNISNKLRNAVRWFVSNGTQQVFHYFDSNQAPLNRFSTERPQPLLDLLVALQSSATMKSPANQ